MRLAGTDVRAGFQRCLYALEAAGPSAAQGSGWGGLQEIRTSLLRIADEQGADGHRSCLTKFSELLLLNGVISTQQMGVALDLVEALFDPGAPPTCSRRQDAAPATTVPPFPAVSGTVHFAGGKQTLLPSEDITPGLKLALRHVLAVPSAVCMGG